VHPMAVVVLGGLVTTTAVAVFVLPALYARFATPAPPTVTPEEELMHRWIGVEHDRRAAAAGPSGGPASDAPAAAAPSGDGG
jgi:predicted exporter